MNWGSIFEAESIGPSDGLEFKRKPRFYTELLDGEDWQEEERGRDEYLGFKFLHG